MGKYNKTSIGEDFAAEHRLRRNWKKVVSVLSCFVVVCTIGALTLPAITMNQSACDLEEHQHNPECFGETSVLTCNAESLGIHQHTSSCFDGEGNAICHYADFVIHEHDSACWGTGGNLVCPLKEIKEHQHDDSCYQVGEEKIVDAGHTHSDACYQWNASETLVCGEEASEGHTHSDACRTTESVLICADQDENHVHGEGCYENQDTMICGQQESTGHQHTAECYEQVKGDLICQEQERDPVTEPGEKVLVCEKPEAEIHIHGDGCFEKDEETQQEYLTCPLTEIRAHQHTDNCFTTEQVAVCGKTEHIHSADCVADKTADVETASDWEASLPERTGVWADDVVSVASSQIGYTESRDNFQLAEDNETHKGYTRYGAWAGNAYGSWDAMFASFCLHYAGISQEYFPEATGAYAWSITLKNEALYADAVGYVPAAGDLVFFDTDADERADSVGIVETIDIPAEVDALPKLQVIRGDYSEPEVVEDAVCRVEYALDDETLLGYGVLPEQPMEEANGSLTWEGNELSVTVTWDEAVKLPEGAELRVSEDEHTGDGHQAMEVYGWTVTEQDKTQPADQEITVSQDFRLLHIGIYAGEEVITPAAPVHVTVSLKSESELPCRVIDTAGEGAEVEAQSAFADGVQSVSFDAFLPGSFGLLLGENWQPTPTILTHQGEDYSIAVTYGAEAGLPEGVELSVAEYDEDSDTLLERYMQAAELYGWDMEEFHPFQLFNISLMANGEAVEPIAPVEMTISLLGVTELTEYNVTHYAEETAEKLDAISDYADGTQTIRFTTNGFSDYSVSAVKGEGISLAAAPTPIAPVSGYTATKGTYNIWKNLTGNFLSHCTRLTFGGDKANDWGNGITSNTYEDSKIGTVRAFVVELTAAQLTTLDNGGTVTLNNCGYIRFKNTGTVGGKSVDTLVTFDKVTFSGCFKQAHLDAYPKKKDGTPAAVVKPHNNKICVAAVKGGNQLWLGMNYCNDLGGRERYNDTYTYPCDETLDVTIKIVEHGTDNLMNTQFLQVASDIDIWRNGREWNYKGRLDADGKEEVIDDTYRGRYAETFTTLSGFNNTFYAYPGNINNITEKAAGQVSVAANPDTVAIHGGSGGIGGDYSYELAGVYGETIGSSWKMRYSEGWCSTEVEIYIPSWPVTVKKVDADAPTNALSGAKFILSRVENNATVYYTESDGWVQDRAQASRLLTADGTGTVVIDALHPGDYTLTEVEAPPGYQFLPNPISFKLSIGGTVTTSDPMVTVDGNNSLLLTVQNKAGQRLPDTGGMGTILYTFSGGSLMGVSALMYSKKRKERRKGEKQP